MAENEVIKASSLAALQEQLRAQQDEFLQQQREFLAREAILSKSLSQSSSSNPLSFTQGLILGQLSVILVIGIFTKFFVFQDASNDSPKPRPKDGNGIIVRNEKSRNENNNDTDDADDATVHARNISSILEKTYYNVESHSSETLDWFNVLVAQTISQLRTEALISDNIFHSLNDFLEKLDFPDYMDTVRITEIDIGDDFPIFSNCRIKQSEDGTGRLEAKIDVDLSDTITLGIETRLLINYPKPMIAALPIQLSVSLVRFSGCLAVSLISPNDLEHLSPANEESEKNKESGTAIMFSFSPDYRLEFTIKSLIGSRAKLQDIPKISSLIESKLKYWFIERCVEPRFQVIKIPSLWPRSKNTRETTTEKTDT